jgi:LSD1 subclass zinc finger protein
MGQVVVSTECPTCSGPLDFSEGASSIRCPNCGSTLLVTGRKQVLSYWVPPKVKAEVAGAVARTGRLETRVAGARLFFVPFYRLTGHDFQWKDVPPKPEPESAAFPTVGESLGGRELDRPEIEIPIGAMLGWGADVLFGRKAGDTVRELLDEPPEERPLDPAVLTAMRAAPARSAPDGQIEFLDRYV